MSFVSAKVLFLVECVKKIISYMGMQACERSDKISEGKASHALYLAGVYRGGHDVLGANDVDLFLHKD